jgi:hypothetical protein
MLKLAGRLTVTAAAAYAVLTLILIPIRGWLKHLLKRYRKQAVNIAAAGNTVPEGAGEAVVETRPPGVNPIANDFPEGHPKGYYEGTMGHETGPFWRLLKFAARVAACVVYVLLSVSISGPQPLVTVFYASLAAATVSVMTCRRSLTGIAAVAQCLAY